MKKIMFVLLSILMPLLANGAPTTFQVGGINYETLEEDNQAVKVTYGSTKYSGDIVIPATVTYGGKTYSVKKIGQGTFWECTGLKSIVLPEGLEAIENSSFYKCTGLKSITFPSTLISIENPVFSNHKGAFEECTALKSVYFPATMITNIRFNVNIGGAAFAYCTSLKTIYVAGESAISMYDVFAGCTAVTDFVSNIQNPKAYYVDARSFTGFYETANLIVPDGKKKEYQEANQWYAFSNIYEHSNYTKAFAIVTASRGGKVTYGSDDVSTGTQVWGIAKGQKATFTFTPDADHRLLKLLKDGSDVTSSVSNGQYTVSNVQSDFTLEAFFEEGTTPAPQPQTQDKGTANLSIESLEIKAGETKTMLIDMQNPDDQVTMVQFDLRLPDGLSIASGDDAVDIAGRTTWRKHTLTSKAVNGLTRILLYSATNEVIDGTSGAIISIKLKASSTFKGGDVKLENQLMTTPSLVESKPSTYTYNIKGTETPAGDGEPYVVYNNGTLTFYCDNKRSSRQGTVYDLEQRDGSGYTMWHEYCNSITMAIFDPSFANAKPKTTARWFNNCSAMTDIEGIAYLNTSNVTSMRSMFNGCSALTSLDVSHFNTNNVTNMVAMFGACSGLTSLDLSNFNTSNVTDMHQMLFGCSGLTSLDLSNFNTSKVTSMSSMFYNCSSLTSLDLSNFNTSKVTSMSSMFRGCSKLSKLTLGDCFVTTENVDCDDVFSNKLKTVTFTGDIPSSINSKFFEGVGTADAPATLEVPDQYRDHYAAKFDGNKFFGGYFKLSGDNPPAGDGEPYVVYNNGTLTFYCDNKRSSRQGTVYDFPEKIHIDPMWYNEHARDITKAVFDKSFANARPIWTHRWFEDCYNLTDIQGLENLNTSEVTYMLCMFADCRALESLDLSTFDVGKVSEFHGMFLNCVNLKKLDFSGFKTENLYNMYAMFKGCQNLTEIKFGDFDTKGVKYMNFLFQDCKSLETLTFGEKFVSNEKTECEQAFDGCEKLKIVNFTGDIPSSINSKFFDGVGTPNAPVTLNVPDQYRDHYAAKFDGNKFYGGYFKLSGDNHPAGDGEPYVVYNNGTLTFYCDDQRSSRQGTIYDLNKDKNYPAWTEVVTEDITTAVFDASFANARPTTTFGWFYACHKLTEIKGMENLNTSNVTNMTNMFRECSKLTSLDLSHFNTEKVQVMESMFQHCRMLTTLDLSSFNTANTIGMTCLFYDCRRVTKIILGDFNTGKIKYKDNMFDDCDVLNTIAFIGDIPSSINSTLFEGVGTASKPAMLDVPEQYIANYKAKFNGNMFYGGYFTLREAIVPDEKGDKDYGSGNSEINEKTDLDGTVIGNVYYSIAPEHGGYNSAEGCLVVTQPSSDGGFDAEDPFGDDFKGMFTGIVIMVQPGTGTVKVEAETLGGMTLKVKVGNGLPIEMTLNSKSTLNIPYSVDRPTYVYIYAGGTSGVRSRAGSDAALKIYGISWESSASAITAPVGEERLYDVYSISGKLVKRRATSLDALPKGVYIVNGRKVVVK